MYLLESRQRSPKKKLERFRDLQTGETPVDPQQQIRSHSIQRFDNVGFCNGAFVMKLL